MRRKNLILLCAVLFSSSVLLGQPANTPVTIRVVDPSGAVIPRAEVRFVPAAVKDSGTLQTDDRGEILLNLPAGSYALFVSAPGFKKFSQQIQVGKPDSPQVVSVVLSIGYGGGGVVIPEDALLISADSFHAPQALSLKDFRGLPHVALTVHNSHANADETYSGVPLATLLAKVNAPLGDQLRKGALTNYVVATGSDGYSVVLSLAEVDPSFHAGQVLVADARDGQPLAKYGPFELIVSDDKRPTRWVHNLNSISLEQAH